MPTIIIQGKQHGLVHDRHTGLYLVDDLWTCPRCDSPRPVYVRHGAVSHEWWRSSWWDMHATCCDLHLGGFFPDGARKRYAIVHESDKGYVTLTLANQGRNHFDTCDEAEDALAKLKEGLRRVLSDKEWQTLTVRAVECYDHGDAMRTVF